MAIILDISVKIVAMTGLTSRAGADRSPKIKIWRNNNMYLVIFTETRVSKATFRECGFDGKIVIDEIGETGVYATSIKIPGKIEGWEILSLTEKMEVGDFRLYDDYESMENDSIDFWEIEFTNTKGKFKPYRFLNGSGATLRPAEVD